MPVAGCLGEPLGAPPLAVALDVPGLDLTERLALGLRGLLPALADACPVGERPQLALLAPQVLGDRLGERHVAAAEALGKVAPLEHLVAYLAVELDGEALRSDLLAVAAAVLVE